MPIPTDTAGLALSIAAGAIKLGKRVDQIMAEETALRSELALGLPAVAEVPTIGQLKTALKQLLSSTEGQTPDPLQGDRAKIKGLLGRANTGAVMAEFCEKYGIDDFELQTFNPDREFRQALRSRGAAWNFDDDDIVKVSYFLAAGADHRQNSLSFRIAATVVDVFAEFAADNSRLLVRNQESRKILESILTSFAEADLAELPGWGAVLELALKETVSGLIDSRDLLHNDKAWLNSVLNGLARARTASEQGNDFVVGLLNGQGFQHLVRGLLEEGATAIGSDDALALERIVGTVLSAAAEKVGDSTSFEQFFQDHWHSLVGAGLRSLHSQGPGLLKGEEPLLQKTLLASVDALAGAFQVGPPTGETLVSTLEAAFAVVADDPALLDTAIGETWIKDLIGSVARTVSSEGLSQAFSKSSLESFVRQGLVVMANHAEAFGKQSNLVETLLHDVLIGIAGAESINAEELGRITVQSTLDAVARNSKLIDTQYSALVGGVAGALAGLVSDRSLSQLRAKDLIVTVSRVVADNPQLVHDTTHKEWLSAVVVSIAKATSSGFIGDAFSDAALHDYAQTALAVFAKHADTFAEKNALLGAIIPQLLEGIASAESFGLEDLGQAVVEGALTALADNHGLIDSKYAAVIGDTAGFLAQMVDEKSLSRIQAAELIRVAADTVAANPDLFLKKRSKLARVTFEAVIDVAGAHPEIMSEGLTTETAKEILSVVAVRGVLLLKNRTMVAVGRELRSILDAGAARAAAEVGRSIDRRNVPATLAVLVDSWARGKVQLPAEIDQTFDKVFAEIANRVTLTTVGLIGEAQS